MAALERLRRRADFLSAARGKRIHARGFTLQVAKRRSTSKAALEKRRTERLADLAARQLEQSGTATEACPEARARFGFVVTKRSEGAVRRNLIRRRLKEALRLIKPLPVRPGYDYVIVARPDALAMTFQALQAELLRALKKASGPEFSSIRHDQQGLGTSGPETPRRMSSNGRTLKG